MSRVSLSLVRKSRLSVRKPLPHKEQTNKARYSSDPTHTHKRTHPTNRASNTETQTSNAATVTGRESVVEEDREDGRADSVWRGPLRSPCWCWRCRSRRKRACGEKSPSSSSPESATESFSQCSVTKDLLAPKALAVRLWTPVKTSPKAADEADWTA